MHACIIVQDMNAAAPRNGCMQCGAPCRFVLCNDHYADRAEGEARS
jgi:hypothetical protein